VRFTAWTYWLAYRHWLGLEKWAAAWPNPHKRAVYAAQVDRIACRAWREGGWLTRLLVGVLW
jgi:hypothetical protein